MFSEGLDNHLDDEFFSKQAGLPSKKDSFAIIRKFAYPQIDWITSYRDPERFSQSRPYQIFSLFSEIAEQPNVSDILVMPDLPVMINVRRRGMVAATKREITKQEAEEIIKTITFDPNAVSSALEGKPQSGTARVIDGEQINLHQLEDYQEISLPEKARYRYELVGSKSINHEDAFAMVLRPLPNAPKQYSELNVPLPFVDSFIIKDGLAVLGGATGEGKTTLLSSIIRYILEGDTIIKGMIVTHEDPIEISYDGIKSKHSYVIQSSIGKHIKSFSLANRAAVRRQPALLMVGELRDMDTIDASLELGKAGSPVFATTHANNVASILPRLLSIYPPENQPAKCASIIDTVRVFATQKLIWTTNNKMMAVRELLVFTPELRRYLLQYCNNPRVVISKIEGIMQHGLFGVESYETQGRRLLDEGIIDHENYLHLTSDNSQFSQEEQELLDQLGV